MTIAIILMLAAAAFYAFGYVVGYASGKADGANEVYDWLAKCKRRGCRE